MQNKKEIKHFEQKWKNYLREHEDEKYEFMYMLSRKKEGRREDILALAVNENDDGIYLFKNDLAQELIADLVNFDDDFLRYLQEGYQIERMNPMWHYNAWVGIGETLETGGIQSKEGLKAYLEFCTQNAITKEFLEENVGYSISHDLSEENGFKSRTVNPRSEKKGKQR